MTVIQQATMIKFPYRYLEKYDYVIPVRAFTDVGGLQRRSSSLIAVT